MIAVAPGFQPSTSRPKNCALKASSSRSWKRGSVEESDEMPRRTWPSSGWLLSDSGKEISKRSLLVGLEAGDCATAQHANKTQMAKRIASRVRERPLNEALLATGQIKVILQRRPDSIQQETRIGAGW